MKLFSVLAVLLIASFLLLGCTSQTQQPPAGGIVTDKGFAKVSPSSTAVTPSGTVNSKPSDTGTASVQEFTLQAKQWEFLPSAITVKKGVPVKLTITSMDVNHGFALPDFGVSRTLQPGAAEVIEFTPDKTGTFTFFCNVFCGTGHQGMKGTLVVTE